MTVEQNPRQIVFTNKARCRDCYRCVRVCPVKAIRMQAGQAFVVEDRCIACGTCVRNCPQQAKSYRNDIANAMGMISSGDIVAASIAPSFAAAFTPWQQRRLPSALREIGFRYVSETAVGAYHVARHTAELVGRDIGRPHIGTACPTVVSFVERYMPDAVEFLSPVVSPMIAHAKILRQRLGAGVKIVFIGPCVAKKAEAAKPEYTGLVDCVLTFTELISWLEQRNIELATCEESDFDDRPAGASRVFPLAGGQLRTGNMATDMLEGHVISVSGVDEVRNSIRMCRCDSGVRFIEPLFCPQGCINGPAMPENHNIYENRNSVLKFADETIHAGNKINSQLIAADELVTTFAASFVDDESNISQEQIRQELEKTGKARLEDQLNCGACGYNSCREKAIAVIRGLAEAQMCIPYMRRLAEQRTDRIIETSPNGIVILDDKLNILSMNPAFRKFFLCSEAVCGKRISYLIDPEPFEKLATGQTSVLEMTAHHKKYNLLCHQILYAMPEERQYIGIFVNITHSQASQEKLDELRTQTIMQARELYEHQLNMAQNIAQFLGESTARGERLVSNLMQLASDELQKTPEKKNKDIWRMYTSK